MNNPSPVRARDVSIGCSSLIAIAIIVWLCTAGIRTDLRTLSKELKETRREIQELKRDVNGLANGRAKQADDQPGDVDANAQPDVPPGDVNGTPTTEPDGK